MRSRTELVTTTFIDSEEEQSESDDSEEDWRPESSLNGKKRLSKSKRRNKRKASMNPKLLAKKKLLENLKEEGDSDDDDYQKIFPPATSFQASVDQKSIGKMIENKSSEKQENGLFNLYLYKKDLDKDYKNNSHLCLWRRDGSSLLQKYIRVKTNNCEEFIFTSSSVYSSWDERRRKDFAAIAVKCMEDNNRRVIIQDPAILKILSDETAKRKFEKTEGVRKADEDSSNEMLDSHEEEGGYDDDDDDDEEEMSGEDDIISAKSSDGEEDYYAGEEGSTNEGTSHP